MLRFYNATFGFNDVVPIMHWLEEACGYLCIAPRDAFLKIDTVNYVTIFKLIDAADQSRIISIRYGGSTHFIDQPNGNPVAIIQNGKVLVSPKEYLGGEPR